MAPPRWREAAAAVLATAGLTFVIWHLRRQAAGARAACQGRAKEDEREEAAAGATSGTAESSIEVVEKAIPVAPLDNGQAGAGPTADQGSDWQPGDMVIIQGLRAKPELNGLTGTVERFVPEKGRWVVRVLLQDSGIKEGMLLKSESLARAPLDNYQQVAVRLPPAPQLRVPAVLRQQPVRELTLKDQTVRLFGVASYTGSIGCDEVFRELEDSRPSVVLMESFDVGEEVEVEPGNALPYRQLLGTGLGAALRDVGDDEFRKACCVEAVAVLGALRVGAEIRLCDRLHVASFDRLISHLSLDELKLRLLQATEAIANLIEQLVSREAAEASKAARKPRPIGFSDLPQNSLCPFFEELGSERRRIMAHFASTAAEQGNDVLVVVGAEHIAEIEGCLQAEGPGDVKELLSSAVGDDAANGGESLWLVELEKRALMAAFLNSTRTFPPEVVLLPREQLLPEYGEHVAKIYPKYREMFMGRLSSALSAGGGQQQLQDAMKAEMQRPRLRGLAQLHEFRNA